MRKINLEEIMKYRSMLTKEMTKLGLSNNELNSITDKTIKDAIIENKKPKEIATLLKNKKKG